MKKIIDFIHGRFGKRVLKEGYREIWVRTMYCLIMILGLILFAVFLEMWSSFIDFINYVAWG